MLFQKLYNVAKEVCIQKCEDKDLVGDAEDLCMDKQDLLCKAKYDCKDEENCNCQIIFFCKEVT